MVNTELNDNKDLELNDQIDLKELNRLKSDDFKDSDSEVDYFEELRKLINKLYQIQQAKRK